MSLLVLKLHTCFFLRSEDNSPVSSRGRTISTTDSPKDKEPSSTLKKVSKSDRVGTDMTKKHINNMISQLEVNFFPL